MSAEDDMPQAVRRKLSQQAADWFARSRAGNLSKADRQDLQAWLDVSADHRAAYIQVIDLWNAAEKVRTSPEVLTMREATLRRYPASARRRMSWPGAAGVGMAAAAVVAAVALAVALTTQPVTQVFETRIGQTATVALIDGSRLTLDTDTTVRTRISGTRRQIFLDRGRAFFVVAKDSSRPFVVEAGGRSVTATGTQFEVMAEAHRFEVLLVEGHVRVSQAVKNPGLGRARDVTTDLNPGTRLIGVTGGKWILAHSDGTDDLAWMDGQLLFDNKPLGEIAAEMNRYSRRKIVINDPAVASLNVYGAFMAGDVDQFVHALVDYRMARIQSQSEASVVLAAP